MAVWEKNEPQSSKKGKKSKKEMPVNLILFVLAIIIAALAFWYVFLAPQPGPVPPAQLTITTSEQPAKIGWATITVESDIPLQSVTVYLGSQKAMLKEKTSKRYVFKAFVPPEELPPAGVIKQIIVDAVDEHGRQVRDDSRGLFVGYTAAGDVAGDVLYYSYDYDPPTAHTLEIVLYSDPLSFFFEGDPAGSDRNSAIAQSFIPLVQRLGALNTTLKIYGVEVENDEWVVCRDKDNAVVELGECKRVLDEEPSIILRLPDYPTSQVYVHNTTIEFQPRMDELDKTVNSLVIMLEPYITVAPQTNQTGNQSA